MTMLASKCFFLVLLSLAIVFPSSGWQMEVTPPKTLARVKGLAIQMCIALQEEAERLERAGQPTGSLRRAFVRKAGLTEEEGDAMIRIATRVRSDVAPLDSRAAEIIQAARQKHPGGWLKPGEAPPVPPAELGELQRQRDAIVEQALRDLDQELGVAGVAKLNTHLVRKMMQQKPSELPVRTPGDIGTPGASSADTPPIKGGQEQ